MKIALTIVASLFVTAMLVLGGFAWYFKTAITMAGTNSATILEIKKSTKTVEVAAELRDKGLIKEEWPFLLLARIEQKTIKAGVYEVPPRVSMLDLYDLICSGNVKEIKVTIPEGYRVEQIGQVLASNGLVDFEQFVAKSKGSEGKLFPDTYFFPTQSSVDSIIDTMQENYYNRTRGLKVGQEDLIVASIVEREAVLDEERPLIAGIYKNRIARGMSLQADPTVQYGRDTNEFKKYSGINRFNYSFWQPISAKDYQGVNSSYNTYQISALPPGPICNPGLKSITATLNYQKSDYLYFLQSDGKIYPAKTLLEHNQNRVKILGAKS